MDICFTQGVERDTFDFIRNRLRTQINYVGSQQLQSEGWIWNSCTTLLCGYIRDEVASEKQTAVLCHTWQFQKTK